jgi:hypothetical protein
MVYPAMTAPYAWLITHDSIADPEYPLGSLCNARGLTGPRDASQDLLGILHRAANAGKDKWQGTPCQWFKIYDDDGELYYSGIRTGEAAEYGSQELFEPLDDFGRPNAGATEIHYWNPVSKEWYQL